MSRLADRLGAARRRRFIGRSAEQALFQSALNASELPFFVLHLHGPGGVGKTSLLGQFADTGGLPGQPRAGPGRGPGPAAIATGSNVKFIDGYMMQLGHLPMPG